MLRIACVDNEKTITDIVNDYLEKYSEENGVEFDVSTFHDGWSFLESKKSFDIVILDIEMPGLDGMKVAKELRNADDPCVIIFLTNWAQYAINGYEVEAFDFLLKPLGYAKFSLRIRKAIAVAKLKQQEAIIVTERYGKKRIFIRELLYVESVKHKLVYYTVYDTVETWGTMKEAVEILKPFGFSLCNSGLLVNLQHVKKWKGIAFGLEEMN